MVSKILSAATIGIEARQIEIEVDLLFQVHQRNLQIKKEKIDLKI